MSVASKKEITLTKLKKTLSQTQTLALFRSIWEIDRIQSAGNYESDFFKDADEDIYTTDPKNRCFLYKWNLEQILNCSLFNHQEPSNLIIQRKLELQTWAGLAQIYNDYFNFINADCEEFLESNDVTKSLKFTGYQQLPWQNGLTGINSFYRSAYLCDGSSIERHFLETIGVTPKSYISNIFLLFSHFSYQYSLQIPCDLSVVNGNQKEFQQTLLNLSQPLNTLRDEAKNLRLKNLTNESEAYNEFSKSVFRKFPIVRLDDSTFVCPLPELIIFRLTEGLHFDLEKSKGDVRNQIGKRLEDFCFDLSTALFSKFQVSREFEYKRKKETVKSPDIFLIDDDRASVIIECKATSLDHDSKFNLNNANNLPIRSDELIKGIQQIWQYRDDMINCILENEQPSEKIYGVILTLDSWIALNPDLFTELLSQAHKIADEKGISKDSRIPIIIMSVLEFETILLHLDEKNFTDLLDLVNDQEFLGWSIDSIFRERFTSKKICKEYSVDEFLSKYIDWWGSIKELARKD